MSNFKLIGKAQVDELTCANKYRDEETGLTVVLVDVEGPVVNGYFVLSTEAHDDDGLPHTLEHLIFLGSEKYPYKGVLDLLANRCLASGTNAWTDTDHTCYTMTTAGSDGFLDLMPVYLDHILYPTLNDSGFTTEVHHISGEGEDGGVVYCEMQGRENTGESRTILKLLKTVYPNCGYSSETGGVLHNLRTSTTNEKVRAYHKKFYRPENLTLIITGKVTSERVFAALKPVQEKIKSKANGEVFVKPWQTPVEKIRESQDLKILYPSDDEDCGLVYIGYMGPNCVKEYRKLAALGILLRYLTDTSVSPLQRDMVEIDDPYASKVSFCAIENLESLLYFTFENAPIKKIDEILNKLKEILNKVSNREEKIDMQRMQSIIDREFLESLSALESNPHDTLALLLVGDSVYGTKEADLQERLNLKKHHEYYLSITESQWIELLNSYFVNGNYVCVRAFPSIEEQNRMSKDELARIDNQRKQLGEDGLREKGEHLKKSMELNEIEPPSSMLTEVPVPSTEGINYHNLKVYKSKDVSNVENVFNFSEIPIYTEVYNLHTNFTYIMISMNSEGLDQALRPYLLLFMELLLESPVQRGDKLIPYEEVVSALERDTICTGSGVGLDSKSSFKCGPYSHVAMVTMQIEPKKYETIVNWLIDLLYSSVFTAERVRVVASKMHNGISQVKRKGNFMAADILKSIFYSQESNVRISTILKQQKFLAALLKNLDDPGQLSVILNDLNTIRNFLTKRENLTLHIATNISEHVKESVNLSKVWGKINKAEDVNIRNELRVIPDWKEINYKGFGLKEGVNGTVIGMGSVESAFLFHAVKAINDFLSPDLPALMLYLQYLTQLEGPLWKQIRGQGLAYGYTIAPKPNEGLLLLSLYRASNVVAAFKETKRIIETHLQDSSWDANLLESAKSSLIFEIIERERSVGNLVSQGLLFSYKQVPSNYNQVLVQQVDKVTKEQLADVGERYMSQLFSTAAKTGIVCHPDKVKEVTEGFASMNITLSGVSCLDDSILNN